MRSIRGWAAASAVVIVACSSFGTSEPSGPARADGGADSSSSGTVVAPDGAVSDGTADRGRFCASAGANATYCADFDDGELLPPGGWSLLTMGGGAVTLATTARSGTYSMTSASTGGLNPAAAIRQPLGPKPTAVTLAAGVRMDDIAGGDAAVFVIEMKSASYSHYALELTIRGDGTATLEEHRFATASPDYDIANNWPLTDKVPVGRWLELTLVLTMTGGTSTASVQVDGKTLATGAPAAHQMDELTSIVFGEPNADADVSWNIGFDDLRITVTP